MRFVRRQSGPRRESRQRAAPNPLLGNVNTTVNEPVQLCPRVRRDLPTRRQPDVIAVRSDVPDQERMGSAFLPQTLTKMAIQAAARSRAESYRSHYRRKDNNVREGNFGQAVLHCTLYGAQSTEMSLSLRPRHTRGKPSHCARASTMWRQ